jgi:hypothetical protein
MIQRKLARRGVLIAAALTAIGGHTIFQHVEKAKREAASRAFLQHLDRFQELVPLGNAALRLLAPHDDLLSLVSELERRIDLNLIEIDNSLALRAVDIAIENDFDRGDLLELRGWLLPRTTILLAAASVRAGPPSRADGQAAT